MNDATASSNPFALGGEYGRDIRYQQAARLITRATLPTTGTADGTIVRYKLLATATGALNDVWWTFTYDASAGYWYAAGQPLIGYDAASIASSATTTWQATATPSLTVPFLGDYDVYAGSVVGQATAAANVQVGPSTVAIPTPPSGAAEANFIANETQSLNWESAFIAAPVNTQFRHSQWTTDATPGHTATTARTLIVTPLRVK